jgi:UDP-glucose 4-epimerase
MRFFSVYGPNERHKGKYANNITQFLWAMLQDGRPEIYGDGTQSRDFIYVDDVVRALILAMNIENPKAVFNVGTGLHTSFNEIVNKLNTGLKKDIKPVYKDNPIGKNYVSHTQADTTIAEKALGFKAQIPLDEGITKLIEAYK